MDGQGMVQVYTGDGKGKTTASLGLAMRAVGHGLKVLMLQFLKNDENYGEIKSVKYLPDFEICQVGRDCFVNFANPDPIDVKMVRSGWEKAKDAITAQKYDIVILDEINVAIAYGLLPVKEVIDFLECRNSGKTEIVFTGIAAPLELIELADLVTEMKNVKHYFNLGIESRTGIDH